MATYLESPASRGGPRRASTSDDWNRWWSEALEVATGRDAAAGRGAWARWRRPVAARRIVLSAVAVAVLLTASGGGWFGRSTAVADSGPGESLAQAVVIVRSGDSLWSVAGRVDAASDRWAVISRIKEVNRLDSDRLSVGQQLLIPDASAQ